MIIKPSLAAQAIEMDQSVAGRIAAALAERIVSGALSPGSRLMQDHVAEEFQASHVPVREAFRKLEAQGLVISKPRCGVRVSQLDPGMVLEVTEMRAALEGLALHHALSRLGRADLDAAHQALVEGEASDQIAVWEAANRRFHLAITAPCGMSRLMASIGDLHRSDARFLFATWKQLDWQPRSDTEHWAILDAIDRGDSKSARELLESHVREAMTILLSACATANAGAQTTKRIPLPASQNPSGADLPFSAAVWAGDTLYVSGWLDPDLKTHTDTTSQTVGIIKDIQKLLESQNLTLGDVGRPRLW